MLLSHESALFNTSKADSIWANVLWILDNKILWFLFGTFDSLCIHSHLEYQLDILPFNIKATSKLLTLFYFI